MGAGHGQTETIGHRSNARKDHPQIGRAGQRSPAGEWLYEIKFDGYRFTARIREQVTLFTRNGHDWTKRLRRIAAELSQRTGLGLAGR